MTDLLKRPVIQDGADFYIFTGWGDGTWSVETIVRFSEPVTAAASEARSWFVSIYCPEAGITPDFEAGAMVSGLVEEASA